MTDNRKWLLGAGAALLVVVIAFAWIVSANRDAEAALRAEIEEREAGFVVELEQEQAARQEVADALAALEAERGTLADVEAQRAEIEAVLVELEATREETRAEIDAEIAELTGRRDAAREEMRAAEGDRDQLLALLETQSTVLSQIDDQRSAITAEVEASETRLSEIDASLTEQLAELANVGARLENAREQEASLRRTLAEMQAEAATVAEELAGAEQRAQEARATEDRVRGEVEAMRAETAELEGRRTVLADEIATLTDRQGVLKEDVGAAETQRAQVQTELTELTQLLARRSEELAEVETRFSQAQLGAAAAPETDGALLVTEPAGGFSPGRYNSGDVAATFAADGTFSMENRARDESLSGQYVHEAGLLILSEPEGDLRVGVAFPLSCALSAQGSGFRLEEPSEEGSCGPLTGAAFTPMDQ
jgi:chromosome segregation ATPase